ncbi:hypothetical protein KAFR_0B01950 [Kazachstania africana CBS 2517]|uniref:Copper-fist domain-containing protein n=1 Tax=Kazachstania africana (strain ATCC 22294 / BCRC 22015 / CBS 2517 / CECT 1963 / NBRC 1671 / NRRL Y-8276) TaxID=1071382 RepID=H2AQ43_KAZAF|nr:hypothetical protein KAFR_0B01950 [Kazachstania africana CBS 2517]CCF56493.1 hypothetical protein KAFR_0B01950 [Kazachstania africana CBS 2517]
MVLRNGIKYACERCIRGHRVTTCNHSDQPLMMIKPKGRPSTTCAYCKELRKNKSAKLQGTCTCGRQEKRRLAQKAKEDARAKAKELERSNCKCSADTTCTHHGSKPQNKKLRGKFLERATSSTSLDSAFLSSHSIYSDSSNFSSTFLDSDINPGRISKDYHHVASLASISSLQSSQSLDQSLSSPHSPPSHPQFNFLSDFDSLTQSTSQVNLLENVDFTPNSTNKLKEHISSGRSNVGEVLVPLEEYIPPDIDGIGNVNDKTNMLNGFSPNDNSIKDNQNETPPNRTGLDSATIQTNPREAGQIRMHPSHGLFDMFSDVSSISTLSRANLLLQKHNVKNVEPEEGISRDIRHSTDFNGVRSNFAGQMQSYKENSTNNVGEAQSTQSVEVLSITPSFMDIPSCEHIGGRNYSAQCNSVAAKVRSSSIDKNHKYPKNINDANISSMIKEENNEFGGFEANVETENNSRRIVSSSDLQITPGEITGPIVVKEEIPENSTVDTAQSWVLNSPLLSEQGFADLDNFMSTL